MKKPTKHDQDWNVLTSFFPRNWRNLASECGAVSRLRGFASEEALLRTLLLHVARGYSLRECSVRAAHAKIAKVSDVAILKRLRKAEAWFRHLCRVMLEESRINIPTPKNGLRIKAVDATIVKEPGKTGSQWRIHYGLRLPGLECDHFDLTPTEGSGTGETFNRHPIAPQDYIMGDRGYCTPGGVAYVHSRKGYVLVRLNSSALPLFDALGKPFRLLNRMRALKAVGQPKEWNVLVSGPKGELIPGRLCALRKSEQAILVAQKRRKRKANKLGRKLKPATLELEKYVIVFTTFPKHNFSTGEILNWYRVRWQIELIFKRFKSIAQLGHLPKYDEASSKAWLLGKMFVALLTQKLLRFARDFSPWGYQYEL